MTTGIRRLVSTAAVVVLASVGGFGFLAAFANTSTSVQGSAEALEARIAPVIVADDAVAAEDMVIGEELPSPVPAVTEPSVVPAESGAGRRVVFSKSVQRVWLVDAGDSVKRTYLVSGSIHDNLPAGHFRVRSRTKHATAYDYKSTMDYFIGFTRGENATIGFHDIPVDDEGEMIQTFDQLGTPLSSGCIRQAHADALALWQFAPVGTPVVVVP